MSLKIKLKAFSFIELMIVVILVTIIALVAFVNFWNQSWKARNSQRMDSLWKYSTSIVSAMAEEKIHSLPDCSYWSWTSVWFSDLNNNWIADNWEPLIEKTCKFSQTFITNNWLQDRISENGALQDPLTKDYYDYAISNNWIFWSEKVWSDFQLRSYLETEFWDSDVFFSWNYSSTLIPIY